MAPRKEARIKTARWDKDDWTALPIDAQWLYDMLLSQKSLSQAGVLIIPRREWANLCGDDDARARIVQARAVLEERRYIVVDDTTDELLIRTYVRHDILDGPPGVFVAAMDAITAVASPALREAIRVELMRLDVSKVECKKAAYRQVAPIEALRRTLETLAPGSPAPRETAGEEHEEDAVTSASHGMSPPSDTDVEHAMSHRSGVGVGAGDRGSCSVVALEKEASSASAREDADAARMVAAALPRGIGRRDKADLLAQARDALADGASASAVKAGLEAWAARTGVSTKLLPSLISDAVKAANGATSGRGHLRPVAGDYVSARSGQFWQD